MNEADWLTSKHPQGMLTFLKDCGRTSDRKVRLLAAACCRQMWHLFTDENTRRAVKVAEWDVDGLTNKEVVGIAARGVAGGEGLAGRLPPAMVAPVHAAWVALTAGRITTGPRGATGAAEVAALCTAMHLLASARAAPTRARHNQAALIRDLFGPRPFRLVAVDPSWLAWNDGTVKRLAEAAYQDRHLPSGQLDSGRLAVLADSLADAGCANAELTDALRRPGPHHRGFWCLDLLLGKE